MMGGRIPWRQSRVGVEVCKTANIIVMDHRNPQGLMKTISCNGEIWDNEHGPRGWRWNKYYKKKALIYGWPLEPYWN